MERTLAASFLEGGPHAAPADAAALERALEAACARARAACPDAQVSDGAFARHLGACVPRPFAVEALERLELGDLRLACACAAGERWALRAFDEQLFRAARGVARRSPELADEVCQRLRVRLLVADGRPCQLLSYSGRAPLVHWLRVAATREALEAQEVAGPALDEHLAARAPGDAPDLALIKERYRRPLGEALRAALAELTPQERNMLRLHLLEGLTIEQVGAHYGVHRSTATRWMTRLRQEVADKVRARLAPVLGTTAEFDSLLDAVRSQLDVSLRSALGG